MPDPGSLVCQPVPHALGQVHLIAAIPAASSPWHSWAPSWVEGTACASREAGPCVPVSTRRSSCKAHSTQSLSAGMPRKGNSFFWVPVAFFLPPSLSSFTSKLFLVALALAAQGGGPTELSASGSGRPVSLASASPATNTHLSPALLLPPGRHSLQTAGLHWVTSGMSTRE